LGIAELQTRARVNDARTKFNCSKKKMNTSVIQSEESAWKTSAPETFSETGEPKKQILVVESDKAGARKLALQLVSAGYEAMTHDVANAVSVAKKHLRTW